MALASWSVKKKGQLYQKACLCSTASSLNLHVQFTDVAEGASICQGSLSRLLKSSQSRKKENFELMKLNFCHSQTDYWLTDSNLPNSN